MGWHRSPRRSYLSFVPLLIPSPSRCRVAHTRFIVRQAEVRFGEPIDSLWQTRERVEREGMGQTSLANKQLRLRRMHIIQEKIYFRSTRRLQLDFEARLTHAAFV